MNRADFLKRLGLGAIGIAVAPMVKADDDEDVLTSEEEDIIKREIKRSIEESPPAKVMLMDKGQQWTSLYDIQMEVPKMWGEIKEHYGEGVGLLDWIYKANLK